MSVGGLMAVGKYRKNLVKVMPKKLKSPVAGRKRSCNRGREGRAEADKEERVKAISNRRRSCDRRKN